MMSDHDSSMMRDEFEKFHKALISDLIINVKYRSI
jgi:hypothetical protein